MAAGRSGIHETLSTRHIPHLMLVAVVAAALAGCGGNDRPTATATATTTATPALTATPTPASTATATPAPTATATPAENAPGGGGDEAAARVPVALTIQPDGQVSPATVSVPAFLALELIVHNRTGAPLAVRFDGVKLAVGSGATVHRRLEGLRKGRYPVRAAGAGTATVIVGVEPGP
jgi:hypothetical protein